MVASRAVLTPEQTRFLRREQMIAPAVFNFVFNVGAGWLVFRQTQPVPIWFELSMPGLLAPNLVGDILGMFFFLPFVTCLLVTPLVRRAAQAGKVTRVRLVAKQHPILRHFPASTWQRGALVGSVSALGIAPFAIGLLSLFGAEALPLATAVGLKGVLAAGLAALTTPWFALYVLADDAQPHA